MDRRVLKSQLVRHRDRPCAISNRTGGVSAQLGGVAAGPVHWIKAHPRNHAVALGKTHETRS
jgi:hypothetical protein